jgi:hypothetical protein
MQDGIQPIAITRWVIQHDVVLFYGTGGVFQGEAFTRWLAEVQAAKDLRLCVCGAGAVFSFDSRVRPRSTEYFTRRKLPFAVITDNAMHRVLGSTARLGGMDLEIYSWNESERPFLELGLTRETTNQLIAQLLRLRKEVDAELEKLATS